MFDKSLVVPRKDPLRASRIYLLASQSTFKELGRAGRDVAHQRDRGERLLINALECLLVVQSERAVEAAIYEEAQRSVDEHAVSRFGFSLDFGSKRAEREHAQLLDAIDTLTEALALLRARRNVDVDQFVETLGEIAENLSAEESN